MPRPPAPPRRKRTFFSKPNLPVLALARPPSPTRNVSSDRVLAALQPDTAVVSAAKTFVTDKMGDDKYIVQAQLAKEAPPVTRGAAAKEKRPRGRPPKTRPSSLRQSVAAEAVVSARTTRTEAGGASGGAPGEISITRKITLRTTSRLSTSTTAAESHMPEGQPIAGPSRPAEDNPSRRKEYMTSGFYCQDSDPEPERMLVNRVLAERGPKRGRQPRQSLQADQSSFPPLPLDHGYVQFFDTEHEFVLPFNIAWESERGALDGKKRPPLYGKLRANNFSWLDRAKRPADPSVLANAVCKCDPESGCGDNCINRIMSYTCGKDCPCGEDCSNKSLVKRKGMGTKVAWTGSRGFGLFATEPIAEGEYVIDYRGEIISTDKFIERIETDYKGQRNFYALHYDRDEVIDAGMKGNDARFINHGCAPNLEVRKLQTIGDGYEEFEIGFWAARDIAAGEELFYDYNFDSFSVTSVSGEEGRQACRCGAPHCVGFLGRKAGEKSAKEREVEARAESKGKGKIKIKLSVSTGEKRKVGRPKKVVEDSESEEVARKPRQNLVSSNEAEIDTPVKKIGRPRKHPLPEPDPPKRPVGRPRKHPLVEPPSPVVPAKRPIGRPRKHPLPEPEPESPVVPAKRPIGRPRKHPLSEAEPVVPASPVVVKRPIGRPRKHPLPDTAVPEQPAPPVVAKRPGRPRKHLLPEDADTEETPAKRPRGVEEATPATRLHNRRIAPAPTPPPALATLAPDTPATPATGKRPVGRPRKHPVADANTPQRPVADADTPKRPIGRPRKHPLPEAPQQSPAHESVPAEKKHIGRPRKHPLAEVEAGAEAGDEQTPVKRPRGRPRKHPLPEPAPEPEPAPVPVVTPKRGRGRPRKHPLPEAVAGEGTGLPEPAAEGPAVEAAPNGAISSDILRAPHVTTATDSPVEATASTLGSTLQEPIVIIGTQSTLESTLREAPPATLESTLREPQTQDKSEPLPSTPDDPEIDSISAELGAPSITPESDLAGSAHPTDAAETPGKRGRGRPRIHPRPDPETPKRPRGRPRIHPKPDPDVAKRPRGRPRIHPKPEPLPDGFKKRRGRPPKSEQVGGPFTSTPLVRADDADVEAGTALRDSVAETPLGARRVRELSRPRRSVQYTEPPSDWESEGESGREPSGHEPNGHAEGSRATSLGVKGTRESSLSEVPVSAATSMARTPVPHAASEEPERRRTAKRDSMARRNGAPAGWAYVPIPGAE